VALSEPSTTARAGDVLLRPSWAVRPPGWRVRRAGATLPPVDQ